MRAMEHPRRLQAAGCSGEAALVLTGVVFFQAEDGIGDVAVTGVQTCALPIFAADAARLARRAHILPPSPRIQIVASSETGIAPKDMSAPRQSRSVSSNTTTTSAAPTRSELRSLAMALSMKLAGRSSAGW